MDREAWRAAVHLVAKSRTQLSYELTDMNGHKENQATFDSAAKFSTLAKICAI